MSDQQETSKFSKYGELDELDKQILKLEKTYPAITNVKIAEILGIHRDTVKNRKSKILYREAKAQLDKKAIEILEGLQVDAARTLGNLLKCEDLDIRLNAAKEILKGVNPETQVVDNFHRFKNINEIKKAVKEELGKPVYAEFD